MLSAWLPPLYNSRVGKYSMDNNDLLYGHFLMKSLRKKGQRQKIYFFSKKYE